MTRHNRSPSDTNTPGYSQGVNSCGCSRQLVVIPKRKAGMNRYPTRNADAIPRKSPYTTNKTGRPERNATDKPVSTPVCDSQSSTSQEYRIAERCEVSKIRVLGYFAE